MRNFNETFRKEVTYANQKNKNQALSLSLEDTFLPPPSRASLKEPTIDSIGNRTSDKIISAVSQINPEAASQTDRKLVEIPKGQQIFDKLL